MRDLRAILGKRKEFDSEDNFNKQKALLKKELRDYGFFIGFEGSYQINPDPSREPGPKFPFILGFDEKGISQLNQNLLEGLAISPAFCIDGYKGTDVMKIKGESSPGFMNFEVLDRFPSLEEAIKGVKNDQGPVEFAKTVSKIRNFKDNRPQDTIETTEYTGLLVSDELQNPLYKGQFMDFYSDKFLSSRRGIFQLERVI